MKTISDLLLDLQSKYVALHKTLIKKIKNEIEGRLEISRKKGSVQYFHIRYDEETGDLIKKYICKKEMRKAKLLAQQAYNKKLLRLVERRLKQFKSICSEFQDDELEGVFYKLGQERRKLISPHVLSWKDQSRNWANAPFSKNSYPFGEKEIYTHKLERVRSKSEKNIADRLNFFDVEYRYECELALENGTRIYPDFTIISPFSREEIYWEHFGMMEDQNYVISAMKRIELYHRNGILMGQKLLVTFESEKYNLSDEAIDIIINEYFIRGN